MNRRFAFAVLSCLLALVPLSVVSQTPVAETAASWQGLPIRDFFDASYREILLRDPEQVTGLGLAEEFGVRNDRLTDVSTEYADETTELLEQILTTLRGYDQDALSRVDQLSYDVYTWYLEDGLQKLEYRMYDYLISSFTVYSEDWALNDLLQTTHPLDTHENADDFITRLSLVDWKMSQIVEELWARQAIGIVAPQFMLSRSIEQVKSWLGVWFNAPSDPADISPYGVELYQVVRQRFRGCEWMTPEEETDYTARAMEQLQTSYVPGLFKLLVALNALYAIAPTEGGAAVMPGGAEYLSYAIAHHTSTDLTADEMWDLGISEVARIQTEMRDILDVMGYEADADADLHALWQRAKTDTDLPPTLSWMEEYQQIRANIEAAIEPAFDVIPSAALEIHPAPAGTSHNYYIEPAHDGSRPGIFYAQLSRDPFAVYYMPVVFHHEAIPGHHFQLALIQELDLPLFRRVEMPTSSAEGWAVYAEGLAYELGIYEGNPLANLERLSLELMRAARIVVEMGVHHLGWSYREGATYFAEIMGYSVEAMINLMPRYVGYPGQGSSYTVGLLKIRDLRQRAMDALGDAFELKAFHNVILQDGALPLAIHERLVDEWIQEEGNE
jgi:uncharacterized protein (DUF885 family)